jgi:predicted nucleotidyltransferase
VTSLAGDSPGYNVLVGRVAPDHEELRSRLARDLGARPEVLLALLHGSFTRGETFRDIDVAVWLDPLRLSKSERFRLALDLSVELRPKLGHPVDVRVLNDAPLGFRYHALAGSPLVVRDEGFLADIRARTWDEYLDFQPFARRYLREALSE